MVLFTSPVRSASSASETASSPLRKAERMDSARSTAATPSSAGLGPVFLLMVTRLRLFPVAKQAELASAGPEGRVQQVHHSECE